MFRPRSVAARSSILAVLLLALVQAPAFAEKLDEPQPGLMTYPAASAMLAALPLDTDGANPGYSREEFYDSWRVVTAQDGGGDIARWYGWDAVAKAGDPSYQKDVQDALDMGKGCDAREITLIRDAVDGDVAWARDGDDVCEPTSGTWYEDYGSTTTSDPSSLDIEHVVAMQDAWDTGAAGWSEEQRLQFSHDPLVLVAVSASENRAKGSAHPEFVLNDAGEVALDAEGDPTLAEGGWVPSNKDAWPAYALRYISIKGQYDLSLHNKATRVSLAYMLSLASAGEDAPAPEPVPEPEPSPSLEPAPEPAPTLEPTPGPALEPEPSPESAVEPEPSPVLEPTAEPVVPTSSGPAGAYVSAGGRPMGRPLVVSAAMSALGLAVGGLYIAAWRRGQRR